MHVSVTFDLHNPQQAEAFDKLRATVPAVAKTATVKADVEAPAEAPKKRGRPPGSVKKVEKPAEEDEDEDEEIGEDDEDLDDEDEPTEDEDDVIDDDDKKKLQTALRDFAKSKGDNGKSAAIKALKKFAPSTSQVKKADLQKLLKALKAA